jgi:hypothetical protein
MDRPFRVEYLDAERLLPVLVRKAARRAVTWGETSVDVCAHGAIVVAEALVCARQRLPQFPLPPYTASQLLETDPPEVSYLLPTAYLVNRVRTLDPRPVNRSQALST